MNSENKLSPIVVRPAELSDAQALFTRCWPDRLLADTVDILRKTAHLAATRRGLGVVGLWGGLPCSFGLLTLWPRVAEISDLIVSSELRSRGIGSTIVNFLTDIAWVMNAHTVEIGAALSNPRALALYRRLGFVDGRIVELELGNGPEPVIYLYKTPGSGR